MDRALTCVALSLGAVTPAATRAQGAHQDAAATPAAFVHEGWTVQDGLPVNAVNDVVQDHRGYLWLATWDGLVRFDGVRFTVFNTGNTDALPSNVKRHRGLTPSRHD